LNRKFVSKSNRVLRKVLNSEKNLDIVQDFIESILNINISKIKLNPYLEKKSNYLPEKDNFGIVDVRITLENKEEINVGIQFIDGYYIQSKMLLYYAQIHTNQLELEQNISKTVTINLLDFKYFNSKDYHKKILIKDNCEKLNEQIELHVIELPKVDIIDENISKQDAWACYFSNKNQFVTDKILENFEKVRKLDELLDDYWKNEKIE